MKVEDFDMFSALLKQRSGLVLSRDKAYLLESRLMPVARKWNMKGWTIWRSRSARGARKRCCVTSRKRDDDQ